MKTAPLSKTYNGHTLLELPTLELVPGKICAIIGANGSGKSTMARVLSGVIPPDKGGEVFAGHVRVGYMPQRSYAFRMNVLKNTCLTGGSRERAMELLEKLGIGHLAKRNAGSLSGGETARMALARLMMRSYELVILDEPTASMDIESTLLAEKLMTGYVKETGCAMLLVTHSLQQARRVADEALFLHKGRLLEAGAAEKVLYTPENEETGKFLEFYGMG